MLQVSFPFNLHKNAAHWEHFTFGVRVSCPRLCIQEGPRLESEHSSTCCLVLPPKGLHSRREGPAVQKCTPPLTALRDQNELQILQLACLVTLSFLPKSKCKRNEGRILLILIPHNYWWQKSSENSILRSEVLRNDMEFMLENKSHRTETLFLT